MTRTNTKIFFTKEQRRLLRCGSDLISNHVIYWGRQMGKRSVVNFWRFAGKVSLNGQ